MYHQSIAQTPASVNLLNVGSVRRKLYGKMKPHHSKKYKFNVGDFVRLSLRKCLFKKGYKANFTEEVYTRVTYGMSAPAFGYPLRCLEKR